MNKIYPLAGLLTIALSIFHCTCVRAQILATQDFESSPAAPTWAYTPNPPAYNNADGDVWEVTASVATIGPSTGAAFFGGRDIANTNGGTATGSPSTLDFAPIDKTGLTDVFISLDFNAFEFETVDFLAYELVYDGVTQPQVDIFTAPATNTSSAGWETLVIPVSDAANLVSINLIAVQNGQGDYFGFDNVTMFRNACGVTTFGPATVICLTEDTAPSTDQFRVEIPYTGVQPGAMLKINAGATTPANDVTATTTNSGDDPAVDPDGLIVLTNSAGEFEEGDELEVILFTTNGDCADTLRISTTDNQCNNPCDIVFDPLDVRFFCNSFTAGNDAGFAYFPFSGGPEPGVSFSVTGATIDPNSDDPATDTDGNLIVRNLTEGTTIQVTISGGPCGSSSFFVPIFPTFCVEPPIVINEVLADPGTDPAFNDTNGDGVTDSGDEFVELYNRSNADVDVSGYVVEDENGARYTFPAGTIIPARTGFVVIGDPTGNTLACPTNATIGFTGLGLNNTGDIVALRRPDGFVVHNMSYGPEGNNDQSLALNPDGDYTQPYVQHTTITTNPVTSSPCVNNDNPLLTLPVELTEFTARPVGKTVQLAWATAAEEGNDRFEIERSRAGETWQNIGSLPAASPLGGTYAFTDEAPLAGDSYYRLRQVDVDGTATHYGPRRVTFTGAELSVYPNPTSGILRLNQPLADWENITVLGGGARVQTRVQRSNGGLDVGSLPPGVYFLRLQSAERTEIVRFVKR